MRRLILLPLAALAASVALCQTGRAQQPQIKRTDLLTTDLADLGNKQMHVWVADIAPGAGLAVILILPRDLFMWSRARSWSKWTVSQQRPSKPAGHSWKSRTPSTISGMRALQKPPELSGFNMQGKSSRYRSARPESTTSLWYARRERRACLECRWPAD